MANNVSFLLGEQKKINELISKSSGITAGAFYVTQDTHRMYFGASATSLVALNEGVTTVEAVADLPGNSNNADEDPITGSFYYVSNVNVLCVYNGTSWVQINPDTTNSSLTAQAAGGPETASLTYTLTDNKGNTVEGTSKYTGVNIKISGSGDTLTFTGNKCSLSVAKEVNNSSTVTLTNSIDDGTDNFTIAGSDYTTVTADPATKKITIASKDSHVSDFAANAAQGIHKATVSYQITNTGNDAFTDPDEETMTISGDGTTTTIIATAADKDKKTAADIKVVANEYDLSTTDNGTKDVSINLGRKLNNVAGVADKVTLKGGTNVKSLDAANDVITLDTYDTSVKSFTSGFTGTGFSFTLEQEGGATNPTREGTLDPIIKIGKEEHSKKFVNGTADLDVYTITEVDKLIQDKFGAFNAMQYIGLMTETKFNSLTTASGIRKGDTYKVETSFGSYKTGDLLIANGTETLTTIDGVKDYFITSNLVWEHIPSGDDASIYTVQAFNHGIEILTGTTHVGKIQINENAAANPIKVNSTLTDGKDVAIDIYHKNIGTLTTNSTAQAQAQAGTTNGQIASTTVAKVVRNLVKDDFGHIVSADIQDLTLYDTHARLTDGSTKTEMLTADKVAKITHTVTDSDGAEASVNFQLAVTSTNSSLDLDIDDSTDTVTLNLVWGTF